MKFKPVHENYNVADLEKSREFYKNALGLTEKRRHTSADGSFTICFIGTEDGGFEMELTCLANHPQKYDLGEDEFHIAFVTDDFEAAHKHHAEMGCICFENTAMGLYFIEDPDGYWIEILPVR
jgi:lactoylglutathione lyase